MATIMDLPDEVLAIIFGYSDIAIEDIINFRCTCKDFQYAVKYDQYHKKKFYQRWPSAKKLSDKKTKKNEQKKKTEKNEQNDKQILSFINTGINCVRHLRNIRSQIISKHYSNNTLVNNSIHFKDVFQLDKRLNDIICNPENFINNSFFIDEIENSLVQSSRRASCDLTKRYCDMKLFHYLRQWSVREKWEKFKKQPPREQLLERTATIIAQWFQPQKNVYYSCVKLSLDDIAQGVLNCLKKKHPDHLIFSTSAENFSYWRNNNIDENYWNEEEGAQIMNTIQEYIFGVLKFRSNKSTDKNLEKFLCIDNVLKNKCGQEIVILIIYHSVARRLGLRCDVVKMSHCYRRLNLPCDVVKLSHCHNIYIFWKAKYATNSSENVRCFNSSFNLLPDCVKQQSLEELFIISSKEILLEMLENLVNCNWNNNILMITPKEMTNMYVWSTNFKELSIDIKKTEQSNRSKDVKFAVGMIVTHKEKCNQSTDNFSGVIIGWHRYVDKDNVTFSINKLTDPVLPLKICSSFTKKQTHYMILMENNELCYVEEDALTTTTPKWIDNSEIGRYFSKFENTHYVPNEMLAKLFPQDVAVTAAINIK